MSTRVAFRMIQMNRWRPGKIVLSARRTNKVMARGSRIKAMVKKGVVLLGRDVGQKPSAQARSEGHSKISVSVVFFFFFFQEHPGYH